MILTDKVTLKVDPITQIMSWNYIKKKKKTMDACSMDRILCIC